MKVKTSELSGAALDWAVNRANFEVNYKTIWRQFRDKCNFSVDWAISGPIIEREKISLEHLYGAGDAGADVWVATRVERPAVSEESGPTALVAAMRCYVAACLGDEVDVPEELL